jgi:hypothetical protein
VGVNDDDFYRNWSLPHLYSLSCDGYILTRKYTLSDAPSVAGQSNMLSDAIKYMLPRVANQLLFLSLAIPLSAATNVGSARIADHHSFPRLPKLTELIINASPAITRSLLVATSSSLVKLKLHQAAPASITLLSGRLPIRELPVNTLTHLMIDVYPSELGESEQCASILRTIYERFIRLRKITVPAAWKPALEQSIDASFAPTSSSTSTTTTAADRLPRTPRRRPVITTN